VAENERKWKMRRNHEKYQEVIENNEIV